MNAPALAAGAEPADEPSVKHLWLAAGHTLCELEKGQSAAEDLRELRAGSSPVCGPCLLIVLRLCRQAATFLERASDAVAPESATQAWRLLEKTPWGDLLSIESFLRATPDLDAHQEWTAVKAAVHPAAVQSLLEEIRDVTLG